MVVGGRFPRGRAATLQVLPERATAAAHQQDGATVRQPDGGPPIGGLACIEFPAADESDEIEAVGLGPSADSCREWVGRGSHGRSPF